MTTPQPATLADLLAAQRGNKYGAIKAESPAFPRVVFASKHELVIAEGLRAREMAGEIRDLRLQVAFDLIVNGVRIGQYVSDFTYQERQGPPALDLWIDVVADAKSKPTKTAVYRLKKRLLKALYSIEVVEL